MKESSGPGRIAPSTAVAGLDLRLLAGFNEDDLRRELDFWTKALAGHVSILPRTHDETRKRDAAISYASCKLALIDERLNALDMARRAASSRPGRKADLEDLKRRVPVTDALRRLGVDVREGRDRTAGVCRCVSPLHDDLSPSMVLYADGGFTCFGCGLSGDLFTAVQLALGTGFEGAVAWVRSAAIGGQL